jgi:hypothetical protein
MYWVLHPAYCVHGVVKLLGELAAVKGGHRGSRRLRPVPCACPPLLLSSA